MPLHRRLVVSLVVAMMAPCTQALAAPPGPPPTGPTAHDREVIAAYGEAFNLSRQKGGDVWPGFRLDQVPVAFYDPGRVLLLANYPHAPAGFTQASSSVLAALGVPLYVRKGGIRITHNRIAIEGQPIALLYYPALGAGLDPKQVWYSTFVAQPRLFDAYEAVKDREFSYPSADLAVQEGSALEDRLLGLALRATDPGTRRTDAALFAAARAERRKRLAPEIVAYERTVEDVQGSAFYTTWAFADRGTAPDYVPTGGLKRLGFTWTPMASAYKIVDAQMFSFFDQTDLRRDRYKYTGMAEAVLLDRLGQPWKEAIAGGTGHLDDLLAKAAGYDAGQQPALLQQARRVGQFPRISAEVERRARAFPPALEAFERSPGLRVTLSLPPVDDNPDDPTNPDGSGRASWLRIRSGPRPVVLDERRQFAYELDLFDYKLGGTWLRLQKTPMLMEQNADQPHWLADQVSFFMNHPVVEVDGTRIAPRDGDYPFHVLRLKGPLGHLETHDGTLHIAGRRATVTHN